MKTHEKIALAKRQILALAESEAQAFRERYPRSAGGASMAELQLDHLACWIAMSATMDMSKRELLTHTMGPVFRPDPGYDPHPDYSPGAA